MKEVLGGNKRAWSMCPWTSPFPFSGCHPLWVSVPSPVMEGEAAPRASLPHKELFAVWRAEIPNGMTNAKLPSSFMEEESGSLKMSTEHNNNENLGSHCPGYLSTSLCLQFLPVGLWTLQKSKRSTTSSEKMKCIWKRRNCIRGVARAAEIMFPIALQQPLLKTQETRSLDLSAERH